MKILAFDSSSDTLSLSLHDGLKEKAAFTSESFMRHSETLIPILQKLLKKARWRVKDIEVIAVGLGPGSFSGLRIGLMAAKILSYVSKAKLVGVSSLAAVAHASGKEGDIAVTRDAKKGLVYAALYQLKNGDVSEKIAPSLFQYEQFLKRCPKSITVISDFAAPSRSIAALAMRSVARNKYSDIFKLEPQYLHPRDCNVTAKK